MADIQGLFGLSSPQQLQQNYLNANSITPAQMGNQTLLQQVASSGANAGAGIGSGLGRLFGGTVPGEEEAIAVQNAFSQVSQMDLPNQQEKMKAMSSLLGQNPITQKYSLLASEAAQKAETTALAAEQVKEALIEKRLKNSFDKNTYNDRVNKLVNERQASETTLEMKQAELADQTVTDPLKRIKLKREIEAAEQVISDNKVKAAQLKLTNPVVYAEAVLKANENLQIKGLRDAISLETDPTKKNILLEKLITLKDPTALLPKKTSVGTEAELFAQSMVDSNGVSYGSFAALPPDLKKEVVKMVQDTKNNTARLSAGGGVVKPGDIGPIIDSIRKDVTPSLDSVTRADSGLDLIQKPYSQITPAADKMSDQILLQMTKDSNISMPQVNAVANANGLVGGVSEAVQKIILGVSTPEKIAAKVKIFNIFRIAAEESSKTKLKYHTAVWTSSGMSKEQVRDATNLQPRPRTQVLAERMNLPYDPNVFDYKISDTGQLQQRKKGGGQ